MRKLLFVFIVIAYQLNAQASEVIPIGSDNNTLYYKIRGGSNFSLPPVSDTNSVRLNSNANLGMGNSCGAFNPALSVSNSMNEIKDSADNLENSIITNATGSLIQLPMYLLAQANPTLYHLLNNALLSAHKKLDVSTKSCETVKDQISNGKNPYQDWGTIAVNNQWKKRLTLISSGKEDINKAKKDIEAHSGEEGVSWVRGTSDSDASLHAGGKGQTPIHVIADTVRAGYNAMLNRDLQNESNAPLVTSSSELRLYFPNPSAAVTWITSVVGDQVITTCNDDNCKRAQGGSVGRGLLPSVTSCQLNRENCVDTIREKLGNLVTDNESITKEHLLSVSAEGIAISPDVIASIRSMDSRQQAMIVNKLAQDVAVQRLVDKASIAKNILSAGAQVPVIAANQPAQKIITHAITRLENDIHYLTFESQTKKQTMSDTLFQVLSYADKQHKKSMQSTPVSSPATLMNSGAISTRNAQ